MLADLWRYRALVLAFANRDRLTRFRSSAVGWLWALAQPLASLAVLSLVFGVILQVPPPPLGNGEGGNYPAFVFTGIVAWGVLTGTLTVSMSSLLSVGPLLRKVQFPAWVPVIGSTLVQFAQVLLEFVALLFVLTWLRNVGWTWLLSIPILVGLLLFSQGIGLMIALLNAHIGDTQHLVTVVLGILYFLTPILYPMSLFEGQTSVVGLAVKANPLSWYVEAMHDSLYSLNGPPALEVAALLCGGAAMFMIGFGVFRRTAGEVSEVL